MIKHLHSNMFLLRLRNSNSSRERGSDLHSNMFLLRPGLHQMFTQLIAGFTFQYVSIKTIGVMNEDNLVGDLHSNMFLLRLGMAVVYDSTKKNLHSNMFLLRQLS